MFDKWESFPIFAPGKSHTTSSCPTPQGGNAARVRWSQRCDVGSLPFFVPFSHFLDAFFLVDNPVISCIVKLHAASGFFASENNNNM